MNDRGFTDTSRSREVATAELRGDDAFTIRRNSGRSSDNSRSRRLGLIVAIAVASTLRAPTSRGLASHHATRRRPSPSGRVSSTLRASSSSGSALSSAEESALLASAREYRRLTDARKEHRLRTPARELAADVDGASLLARVGGDAYADLDALEEAEARGRDARDALVDAHVGLVHRVTRDVLAGGRRLRTLQYEDLVQEGVIGLAKAVDRYDLNDDRARLSTYAYYWIRASVLRALAEKNECVRIPEHVTATVAKLDRAVESLGHEGGMEAAVANWASWREAREAKQLAERIGEKMEKVNNAMEVERRRRSGMVVLMGEVEQHSWMRLEQAAEETTTTQTTPTQEADQRAEMRRVLRNYLKPREAEALSLRYGLTTTTSETYRDYEAEAEEDIFGPQGILGEPQQPQPQQQQPQQRRSPQVVAPPMAKGRWGEAMTFREIGKRMAVSANTGRKLCSEGLRKLQAAVERGDLEPAMLSF